MLIRFLIVALAILNLGVALWWMTPRAAPAMAPEALEAGVATLELVPVEAVETSAAAVPESPPATAATPLAVQVDARADAGKPVAATAPAAAQPVAATPPRPQRCSSFGPFESREQAQAAATTLGADLVRSQPREVPPRAATGYRVLIPPAASREEAQATVKRIVDAGINDYFIIAQGDDANAVALGQYRNREGAERRLAALAAAGFTARIVGNGAEAADSWWLDAAYADTASAEDLLKRSGAAQRQSLECARLR
ncbi:SPOR domain-containing protein [Stenotrophomonas sp. PS02297]|uniref:SPOR domain-containing protein n=1 Tax=Stenotrophomonas sp. PS02297 TaxID=2991423 RepID=UPI00249AE5E5|nr:SPOR domain-containing protein [Stenotrophomonas sp. PS02297]